jgi:hypothetical protein
MDRSAAINVAATSDAVTSGADRLAVARALRVSRPMGVADLSNVYRWTLQGCSAGVNRARSIVLPDAARIPFPTSPTCGIIPPHTGHIGIRDPDMRRIQ